MIWVAGGWRVGRISESVDLIGLSIEHINAVHFATIVPSDESYMATEWTHSRRDRKESIMSRFVKGRLVSRLAILGQIRDVNEVHASFAASKRSDQIPVSARVEAEASPDDGSDAAVDLLSF